MLTLVSGKYHMRQRRDKTDNGDAAGAPNALEERMRLIIGSIPTMAPGHGVPASVSSEKKELRFRISVGIRGMQERAKQIGGRLDIDFTGRGTTIRVTIPVALGGQHPWR
jgi:signal transduction histidine kinase